MEEFDKIVKENLHGSSYLYIWENLPYHLKCVLAESANELIKIKEQNEKV